MRDFILFWLAKPILEMLIVLAFCLAAFLIVLPSIIQQARCKHDKGVRETSACDAICKECGKNLGFIGTWRAGREQAGKQE
jgi:hypothetical protein